MITWIEKATFIISILSIVSQIVVAFINNRCSCKRQEQAISTKDNRDKIGRERTKLENARRFLADYDIAINKVFDEYEKNNDCPNFEGESMKPFKELESQFFIHFPKTFKEEIEKLHEQVHSIFKPEFCTRNSYYIPDAKTMYADVKQKLLNYIEESDQKLNGDPKLTPQANIAKEKNKKFWHHKKRFDKKK